ncbi:peptidase [Streptomyces sp. NPDC048142]|uniref:peptidase n=1 Tax=Streptomyces sp. NPDC048142 TaxID=3365501 RepID=UPI00371F808A
MPPTSCARLCDARVLAALGLAAGITVPAVLLGGPQAAAALPGAPVPAPAFLAAVDEQPACGDPDAKEFPIETRIQDAPDRYASGGGYGTWFLDLTNTTDTSCRALHPVLVLADRDRRLTSDQIQLEFSEPGRPGTEHRVTWESTDRDEQIGVFGGEEGEEGKEGEEGDKETSSGTGTGATGSDTGGTGSDTGTGSSTGTGTGSGTGSGEAFLGFTVPAGETVSVRVRMAFTSDTAPGPVTAHAVVVQRRHQNHAKGGGREDGEWVGEPEEYPFVIVDGATGGSHEPEPPRMEDPRAEHPDPERADPGTGTRAERPGDPDGSGTDAGTGRDLSPEYESSPGEEGGGPDGEHPGRLPRDGLGRPLPELARTGPASLPWTGAAAGALLLGGTALLVHARRTRRTTG